MGAGRTMFVTIKSARGLSEKESGGEICDPYVIICFDGFTQHTIGRTSAVADSGAPVWNERFTVDMSAAVREHSSLGLTKPKTLTFIIRDADTEEALGMTNIPLKTLLTAGSIEGEYEINGGAGVLCVNVGIRRAKVSSMTTSSRGIRARNSNRNTKKMDAGDLLLRYLMKRNKRRKKREKKKHSSAYHSGGAWNGGGVGYGYYDTDSSDEENELVDWFEMDDVSSDESEGNTWVSGYNDGWSTSESDDDEKTYSDSSDSDDGDDEEDDDDDDDGGSD